MLATRTFTDKKKNVRRNGEEWLITFNDTETYIPNVYEEVNGILIFGWITHLSVVLSDFCPGPFLLELLHPIP